ncbi:hypothetical protein COB11_07455 [Candidatus Aerophobetes bacterium]|uniref:Uncharacterized protein n=1 Tax=Aerophobetes bacterium TaxID=2030807 RepID=A0A2A4YC45_UNCAE|nr:MAG: hypothetical protein COB11_07455 [Candidatus Aerophobetes bacterium]
MCKIIDLSSMFEDSFIDDKINKIKRDLDKDDIESQTLFQVHGKLESLSARLSKNLQNIVGFTQDVYKKFNEQQEEIFSLLHLCGTKSLNKQVKKLTDDALKLEKKCTHSKLSNRINELRAGMNDINHKHALSLENRQMIHMAKKHLNELSGERKPQIAPSEMQSSMLEDPIDLSMSLYEIAGNLYKADLGNAFCSFNCLPEVTKTKLNKIFKKNGYTFENLKLYNSLDTFKKQQYFTIQTLLGYSHMLLYGDFELMPEEEVDALFYDLDMTLIGENVADL